MAIEIRVPSLGESVTKATIGKWYKKPGEIVEENDSLLELETDKITVDIPASVSGKLLEVFVNDGDTIEVGALLGLVDENSSKKGLSVSGTEMSKSVENSALASTEIKPAPSAIKLMADNNLNARQISGSGRRGQILKSDVLDVLSRNSAASPIASSMGVEVSREERVRMTNLRQTIASRLKDAQNTAAMLTTFNEVDMTAVMELRKRYRDMFEKKYDVKLGFMGIFSRAVCHALKEIPAINAEINGSDIVYKNYAHIGIAVGTDRGLVVPVVRNVDQMSIAEIEKKIAFLGKLARDGKLAVSDMQGGTFTITNGGIYGSLMSTPILNMPQSGILGMHAIKERPVAIDGKVVVRPMMYLALSYDHRIVDGQEAVTFLVRVKENLEDPQRLVLDL
ncbi:MAG: 2-oxoglutarate dehydrogenase E2 component (dihydrolipoamide succinyltransferase) [Candidatus Tokpelaia sp. JSC188]|nr:MAG: 2-oxoglutarate dehydrogenase E2 component (dihydrolipoamide succinyltransferase) [Candidatus Tokpelaia sp. JSC188]